MNENEMMELDNIDVTDEVTDVAEFNDDSTKIGKGEVAILALAAAGAVALVTVGGKAAKKGYNAAKDKISDWKTKRAEKKAAKEAKKNGEPEEVEAEVVSESSEETSES